MWTSKTPRRGSSQLKPLARSLWMGTRDFLSPPLFSKWQFKMTKWLSIFIFFDYQKWRNVSHIMFIMWQKHLKHGKYWFIRISAKSTSFSLLVQMYTLSFCFVWQHNGVPSSILILEKFSKTGEIGTFLLNPTPKCCLVAWNSKHIWTQNDIIFRQY